MALRFGRTIYEGSCAECHGPDLKGDRGPAVNDAVKRLGADAIRKIVKNGKGGMPAFPTMNAEAITDVIEFLDKSEQAPPGTGVSGIALTQQLEPDYPLDITPPPPRYKTGYGHGRLYHYAAMEHDHGVRLEHRQNHVADTVWRYAAGRSE